MCFYTRDLSLCLFYVIDCFPCLVMENKLYFPPDESSIKLTGENKLILSVWNRFNERKEASKLFIVSSVFSRLNSHGHQCLKKSTYSNQLRLTGVKFSMRRLLAKLPSFLCVLCRGTRLFFSSRACLPWLTCRNHFDEWSVWLESQIRACLSAVNY